MCLDYGKGQTITLVGECTHSNPIAYRWSKPSSIQISAGVRTGRRYECGKENCREELSRGDGVGERWKEVRRESKQKALYTYMKLCDFILSVVNMNIIGLCMLDWCLMTLLTSLRIYRIILRFSKKTNTSLKIVTTMIPPYTQGSHCFLCMPFCPG